MKTKHVLMIVGIVIVAFIVYTFVNSKDFSGDIANELSTEHVEVQGTKISIVPPEGWTVGNGFDGFQNEEDFSSLMIAEMPGPYSEASKGMTKEKLKMGGMILDNQENVKVNGMDGMYLNVTQEAYEETFRKYMLVFGSEKATVMLTGSFLDDLKGEVGKEIETSIFSVVYEPNKEIDLLASVDFEVDTSGSKLTLASMFSNTLMYTVDGIVPTESIDKTSLAVGTSAGSPEILDTKQFAIDRLKRQPLITDVEIESITPVEIDDMSGYEIIAYGIGEKTNETELRFQLLLYGDTLYYMILGTAKDDFEGNIEMFRDISLSFKRK